MPVADYPLPKTYHAGIKGGVQSKTARGQTPAELKLTPMLTPGPMKYHPRQIEATMPNIKGGTLWKNAAPRFKESGSKISKTDLRNYTPLQPSTQPKWSVPKGAGHKQAIIKGNGADVMYNPKKEYCDCAVVNGILVQGPVQGLGSRAKKVADFKMRAKSEARVNNYPKRPGPGQYQVAAATDKVLNRSPVWSSTKMELDKARFPGNYVRTKQWLPAPGKYEEMEVLKKNKVNKGAQIEQQLGRNSSFAFGAT